MSRLFFLPMLTFLALAVPTPKTGGQSPPENPECAAGTVYDTNTNSCIAAPDAGQVPNQDSTSSTRAEAINPYEGIQTSEEAWATDLRRIADGQGWTLEQAAAHFRADDAIDRVAVKVAETRPEIYIGGALPADPLGAPILYIKGPADEFVRSLVADAEISIEIVDNQPFSFDELENRKLQVHQTLEALGFRYIVTGFSLAGRGHITAAVTRQPSLPADASAILAYFSADLRESITLTVNDVPVVVDRLAFDGMQVLDDGAYECTSGWPVWNLSGTTGVTTAGHCDGINQILDPRTPGLIGLSFVGQHNGQWGDVEWHTSSHVEPALFYASTSEIRHVKELEPVAEIMVGEAVCMYGRASNIPDCTLRVQDVSEGCTNDGVFTNRLVLMNGAGGMTNGDSGGVWYAGDRAYGSTKGHCLPNFSQHAAFSVADLYDESLGIRVRVSDTLPANGLLWPAAGADDRLTSKGRPLHSCNAGRRELCSLPEPAMGCSMGIIIMRTNELC